MRRFGIEHSGQITSRGGERPPPEVEDALVDRILEEIMGLADAQDPDVTSTLSTGEVHIRLWVEAANSQAALAKAGAIIRSAMHAADVSTPDWESLDESKLVSEELDWQESDWRITTETRLIDV